MISTQQVLENGSAKTIVRCIKIVCSLQSVGIKGDLTDEAVKTPTTLKKEDKKLKEAKASKTIKSVNKESQHREMLEIMHVLLKIINSPNAATTKVHTSKTNRSNIYRFIFFKPLYIIVKDSAFHVEDSESFVLSARNLISSLWYR